MSLICNQEIDFTLCEKGIRIRSGINNPFERSFYFDLESLVVQRRKA